MAFRGKVINYGINYSYESLMPSLQVAEIQGDWIRFDIVGIGKKGRKVVVLRVEEPKRPSRDVWINAPLPQKKCT